MIKHAWLLTLILATIYENVMLKKIRESIVENLENRMEEVADRNIGEIKFRVCSIHRFVTYPQRAIDTQPPDHVHKMTVIKYNGEKNSSRPLHKYR